MEMDTPCFRLPFSIWEIICKLLVKRGMEMDSISECIRNILNFRLTCSSFNRIVLYSRLCFPYTIDGSECNCYWEQLPAGRKPLLGYDPLNFLKFMSNKTCWKIDQLYLKDFKYDLLVDEQELVIHLLRKFRSTFSLKELSFEQITDQDEEKPQLLYNCLMNGSALPPGAKLDVYVEIDDWMDTRKYFHFGLDHPATLTVFDSTSVSRKPFYKFLAECYAKLEKLFVIDAFMSLAPFDLAILSMMPNLVSLSIKQLEPIGSVVCPHLKDLSLRSQNYFEGFTEYLCTVFPNMEVFDFRTFKLTGRQEFKIDRLPAKCTTVSVELDDLQFFGSCTNIRNLSVRLKEDNVIDLRPYIDLIGSSRLRFLCFWYHDADTQKQNHSVRNYDSYATHYEAISHALKTQHDLRAFLLNYADVTNVKSKCASDAERRAFERDNWPVLHKNPVQFVFRETSLLYMDRNVSEADFREIDKVARICNLNLRIAWPYSLILNE